MNTSRRKLLGAIPTIGIATILQKALPQFEIEKRIDFDGSGSTILFQGDSITDAGRNKAHYYPNQSQGMGSGYVRHIVTELMGQNPTADLQFYNRGISGHRVFQLRDRWEDDCLHLSPDIVSIMIGVNDFWHTLDFGYDGTVEVYEKDLDELLARTIKTLPNIKILIGEPFVCIEGTAIKPDLWKGEFEKYQAACRRVSDKHGATFIPYQAVFDEALKVAPTSYWCPDGVHPSMAGNYLMAQAWLKAYAH